MRTIHGQQLGYCTNVHPYETVEGMLAALSRYALPLRRQLAPAGLLGVGLWLPEALTRELLPDPSGLRRALSDMGLYAFTVNAFPYGDFHGERVKDDVFRPSWAEPERLRYTLAAAEVLAGLLPEGLTGSISTHSGGYKPWGAAANDEQAMVAGWLAAADGLAQLESRTGRTIVLGLEPEPLSFLETTPEVVDLFTRRLLPAGEAARRHLGVCYDACHQAVEYEDMAASVGALSEAGIRLAKVQLSSALRLPDPCRDHALLAPFADDRWFHQVVARGENGKLVRLADLPEALDLRQARAAEEWRVHLHVPLFADPLDEAGRLRTTRPMLSEVLRLVADVELCPHLEIETYSFGLIPEARRRALGAPDLGACLRREFGWVLEQLAATGGPA